MYELKIENSRGEILELTNNPAYEIKSITGLTPMGATINTTTVGTQAGARYNSSRENVRNIVVSVCPRYPVDKNRVELYRYMQSGERSRLHFRNGVRDVYIDGYVETFEGDLFELPEVMQISLMCPKTYFMSKSGHTEIALANNLPLFETPFTIPKEGLSFSEYLTDNLEFYNEGECESGLCLEFEISGYLKSIGIRDMVHNELLTVEHDFRPYDVLRINTDVGAKTIKLIRAGKTYNIIKSLKAGSKWLRTSLGSNAYAIITNDGSKSYVLKATWTELYQGV